MYVCTVRTSNAHFVFQNGRLILKSSAVVVGLLCNHQINVSGPIGGWLSVKPTLVTIMFMISLTE